MSWPKGIYVATKSLGVYYCSDFVDPSTQPTWATVNTGLANVGCREFKLDPFNPENKQYVLTESDRILYRRDNQGSWTSILTPAEANTLLSISGATIGGFCTDETIAGRLWALVGESTVGGYWALYSDDYGANWTAVTQISSNTTTQGMSTIRASGNTVWVGMGSGVFTKGYLLYSYNLGSTWSNYDIGSGQYYPLISHNPLLPNRIYYADQISPTIHYFESAAATDTGVSCSANSNFLWYDLVDESHLRSINGSYLYNTDDNWLTHDTITPDIPIASFSKYAGSGDQMLVGLNLSGQSHAVGAMTGFTTTVTGIAGSSPGSSPYTNSIPDTSGGACVDGVQGVRALGAVYTHGVAMPDYAGDQRGTPLAGDRAAYEASNYPLLHTDDNDTADGIHHTLGTGANQAASGKTVDDHLADTDNPHEVTKTQLGDNLSASTAPTVDDDSGDGYAEGSLWVDTTNDKVYVCLDATVGAAVWQELGAGGGGDMLKSTYDTDDDGVVDEAEAVDGVDAAGNSKYYGTNSSGTPGFYDLPSGGVVDAGDVTYTPAVAADWDGSADPGNADDALDQLAERTKDLEDGGGGGATDILQTQVFS